MLYNYSVSVIAFNKDDVKYGMTCAWFMPADYDKIRKIAKKYGLLVLEDGAQGFGGNINGKMACSFGDIATTSFFPAKPLGCYGDGGAIFTDDDEVDSRLRSLRAQGKSPIDKYDNREIGMNSRLDTLQAAILLPKFKAFKEYEVEAVNKAANWYTERLKDKFVTPYIPDGYYSSWAQYTLLLDDEKQRQELQKKLKENGKTGINVNIPVISLPPTASYKKS